MTYSDPDYDEIDVLIDTDPIALGERCRKAEATLTILRRGLSEIALTAPGGHADPENPCYGVKREFKERAQAILDAADPAVGHDVPEEGGGTRAH